MTARKVADMPHVDMIVIDSDTARYGGSFFRRERTCHMERIKQPVGFTLKCDACGYELGAYETEVERYAYCPRCGARIVNDEGSGDAIG